MHLTERFDLPPPPSLLNLVTKYGTETAQDGPQLVLIKLKIKVKVTLEQATKAQMRTYGSTPSLTSAPDGGGWSTSRLGRFTPGKDPVPIVQ
jgi:hypothetical protein